MRRAFRDSPRLILVGIGVLIAVLVAMLVAANRLRFAPELFTEVVLYALIATDLTMVAALAFVLARNVVKLIIERRRALPFARFRSKLVAVLMAMTVVPAVLVLLVGSELISTNVERWFNAPMDEILSSANQVASDYYRERQLLVSDHATRIAKAVADADFTSSDVQGLRDVLTPETTSQRVGRVAIYRVQPGPGPPSVTLVVEVASSTMPAQFDRGSIDRLAARALAGSAETRSIDPLGSPGDLLHAAAIIRSTQGRPTGVVVATDYLSGDLAARSHRMTAAFESYNQLRVLKRPLTGLYLAFFLMVTLFILVGSLWMGSYLAKRITRPVQALAAAAREIGAGHLDQRVEPQSSDEFGSLVEAFNSMAGELATSRRRVERSTLELERKHVEVEERRRYIETILERITTGIISVDAGGRVTTINSAASRLLTLDRGVVGQSAASVFGRADLQPLGARLAGVGAKAESAVQEIPVLRDGQELQLAVVATSLIGDHGDPSGLLLVLDDVTPLIRAQKVAAWREVARRLAHEIKNPLTPIQLSAERMRRHFAGRPAGDRELVDECAATIVGEVESLKGLVDEFSQFARMPSPRTVPTDVAALVSDTLTLYDGIFAGVTITKRFAPGLPLVRLDVEQIRRVIINLVDNAIEATERKGEIVVETALDETNRVVRVIVADNGPGIPASEREKLFLPYYSTKRRGSGLGLAIVRRIIAEHGGSIEAGDNTPHGTRFTIELPT